MRVRHRLLLGAVLLALGVFAGTATGEAGINLGTFSWALQPFSSTVTLTAVDENGVIVLSGWVTDGFGRHPTHGVATTTDGVVQLGFTTIYPGGVAVHCRVLLDALPSGTWLNNFGQFGLFAFL